MAWRFIPFQQYDPYMKTALNDVAISTVQGTGQPIIWLAGWDRDCITVGQDQRVADTVNQEAVEDQDLPVARRQDTGRAMYLTEQGQVTWNAILPADDDMEDENELDDIYREMCGTVIDALDRLDIDAGYRADHAVTVDDRKISGAMARRSHGVIHISGTLLHDLDPERMIELLLPEKEPTLETVKWLQDRVTTVDKEVEAPFQDTVDALGDAFRDGRDHEEQDWTDLELSSADQLAEKYRSTVWIYRHGQDSTPAESG